MDINAAEGEIDKILDRNTDTLSFYGERKFDPK